VTDKLTTCGRCGGTGRLLHFEHVEKGICFACLGRGTVTHRPARVVDEKPRDFDFELERLVRAARSWMREVGSWEPVPEHDIEVLLKLASPEASAKARAAFAALGIDIPSP